MSEKKVGYILITLMVLINILILVFAVNILFNLDKTIGLAILGGVCTIIGGSLTLVGGYRTLNRQDRNAHIKDLPKKLMFVDDILYFVNQQNKLMEETLSNNNLGFIITRLRYTQEVMDEQRLLHMSSQVNIDTYIANREFYNYIISFKSSFSLDIPPEGKIKEKYKNCLDKIKDQRNRLVNSIERFESKIN